MLLDLAQLHKKLDLNVRGIVHVGAHLGQEYKRYRELFPDQEITWIEGDPVICEKLARAMQHDDKVNCLNAVVSDTRQTLEFFRANNKQSSSILPLGTHRVVHPAVCYVDSFSVETITLDELARSHGFHQSNFLAMDVQGAEGKVVEGGRQFLQGVDYIYSEVNRDELYVGCTPLDSFETMLGDLGFTRVELMLHNHLGWGDAFYVRREPTNRFRTLLNQLMRPFFRIMAESSRR